MTEVTGPIVNETILTYSDWAVLTRRSYDHTEEEELTWQVGPMDGGKEVVVVLDTGADNSKLFTDANGRQMMERNYTENLPEPVAGNYFPVTSRLELRSGSGVVSVVSDRSQGGSSQQPGEMELMVHRRCLSDDGWGVGEALQEEAYRKGLVARGQHFLSSKSLARSRGLQQEKVLSPQLSFLDTSLTLQAWSQLNLAPYSGLKKPLPDSIQVICQ